ncbi:hypothetical protein O3M35_004711 [Rhynocoris fuscipes]|uniref:Macroglobulin domain-containing protein n=1 Tax=Rhynocoris fuscipes TaxID=488301 RepID=A0AAW1CMA9_9HEMI
MPAFFFTSEKYITGVVMANYTSGAPVHGNLTLKATVRPINRYQTEDRYLNDNSVVEKYFNFDEKFPFWLPTSDYYRPNTVPHLRFFNGVYEFRYPMDVLEKYVPSLDGMEIRVTATVGERFLDEVIEAYSTARVFNSSVRINFLAVHRKFLNRLCLSRYTFQHHSMMVHLYQQIYYKKVLWRYLQMLV